MGMLGINPVSERIALWVRDYPAKELARMFEVEERTARGWREGNFPQNKHLVAMAERWGLEFLEDVFAPVLGEEITPERRLERIERDVKALRLRGVSFGLVLCFIATLGGFVDGGGDDPMVRVPRPTNSRPTASRTRRD